MLINNLGHDHNFECDKWDNNVSPPSFPSYSLFTNPWSLNILSSNTQPSPNFPSSSLDHIPSTSHLVDEMINI